MNKAYIAVYIADLDMPWVKSLKEKRSIIKPITEKLKSRFPVSVARLDGLDSHHWERIGVVAISHDAVWLESLLAKIHSFVSQGDYRIRYSETSVDIWDIPSS